MVWIYFRERYSSNSLRSVGDTGAEKSTNTSTNSKYTAAGSITSPVIQGEKRAQMGGKKPSQMYLFFFKRQVEKLCFIKYQTCLLYYNFLLFIQKVSSSYKVAEESTLNIISVNLSTKQSQHNTVLTSSLFMQHTCWRFTIHIHKNNPEVHTYKIHVTVE